MQEDVGRDDVEGEEVNDPELQVKGKAISPNKKVNKIGTLTPINGCMSVKSLNLNWYVHVHFFVY